MARAAAKREAIALQRAQSARAAALQLAARRSRLALVSLPPIARTFGLTPPSVTGPPWPMRPGQGTVLVFHGADVAWGRDAGMTSLLEELRLTSQCPVVLLCERVPSWMRAGGSGSTAGPWGGNGAGPGSTNLLGDPSLHPENPGLGVLGAEGHGSGRWTQHLLEWDEGDGGDDALDFDDLNLNASDGRRGRKRKVSASSGLWRQSPGGPVPCLSMAKAKPAQAAGVVAATLAAFAPLCVLGSR